MKQADSTPTIKPASAPPQGSQPHTYKRGVLPYPATSKPVGGNGSFPDNFITFTLLLFLISWQK